MNVQCEFHKHVRHKNKTFIYRSCDNYTLMKEYSPRFIAKVISYHIIMLGGQQSVHILFTGFIHKMFECFITRLLGRIYTYSSYYVYTVDWFVGVVSVVIVHKVNILRDIFYPCIVYEFSRVYFSGKNNIYTYLKWMIYASSRMLYIPPWISRIVVFHRPKYIVL